MMMTAYDDLNVSSLHFHLIKLLFTNKLFILQYLDVHGIKAISLESVGVSRVAKSRSINLRSDYMTTVRI